MMRISLVQGDITLMKVDAIVNAANSSLLGGAGVDGAIHRAAGPQLRQECLRIRKAEYPHGLPIGNAVITKAYRLPARFVIHTVGPVYGSDELSLLKDCYRNSLALAEAHGCASIAFPAISTGAYGVPVALSATLVKEALQSFAPTVVEQVFLVLYTAEDLTVYKDEFSELAG